ncbi:MAG: hypothetical protein QOJ74_160 [Ilumatobacteraceae bacterium]|nr:hypothetical protein [Ilumatobacteraceae bacterium]
MRRAALCACVAIVGVITGCGVDRNDAGGTATPHGTPPPGGTAVNLTEREWRITADIQKVPAGAVKFSSVNLGTIEHELVVIRTDYPDGKIPLEGDGFSEDAPGVSSPGELSEYKPDTVDETVIDLEPGHYQLVCNLPSHYHNGMHIEFEVLPA